MAPAPFQLRNAHGDWRVSEKNPALCFSAEFKCWGTAEPFLLPDAGRGAVRAEKHSLLFYPFPLLQWGSVYLNCLFSRDISRQAGYAECYLWLVTQKPWKAEVKGDCYELKRLTLPVKLFADPFTPLFAQIPDPARVANVSTLECNLKARRKEVVREEVTVYECFNNKSAVMKLPGLASDAGKG